MPSFTFLMIYLTSFALSASLDRCEATVEETGLSKHDIQVSTVHSSSLAGTEYEEKILPANVTQIEKELLKGNISTHDLEVQFQLPRPHSLSSEDWIFYVRIQKTFSKSYLHFLKSKLMSQFKVSQCGHAFAASLSADTRKPFCVRASYGVCSQMVRNEWLRNPHCKLVGDHHCNWVDLFEPLQHLVSRNGTLPPTVHVVTLLRHPLRRCLSEFKHIACGKLPWDYCLKRTPQASSLSKASYLSFLQNPSHSPGMSNRQTRMLSGLHSENGAAMLKSAKSNLLRMKVVGVSELFEQSLRLTAHAFHWDYDEFKDHSHILELTDRTRLPFEIDNEIVHETLKRNLLDLELYLFARNLVNRRFLKLKKEKLGSS